MRRRSRHSRSSWPTGVGRLLRARGVIAPMLAPANHGHDYLPGNQKRAISAVVVRLLVLVVVRLLVFVVVRLLVVFACCQFEFSQMAGRNEDGPLAVVVPHFYNAVVDFPFGAVVVVGRLPVAVG